MELHDSKMEQKRMKHNDDEKNSRDRISDLPDDLLIKLLSFLPPEEALRKTKFLSHRWKQLWEFWPATLSFNGLMPVGFPGHHGINYRIYRKLTTVEDMERDIRKFVAWVDNVLISHQGLTIEELRVGFFLIDKEGSWHYIDKWIEIAMRKKVKRLELDLPNRCQYIPFPQQCYSGIEFLTSLCLRHVGVTNENVEWILSNCPMLETLHLEDSLRLTEAKVSGSSLRLKHLNISDCMNIQSIHISAPNLVSFEHRDEYGFLLKGNVPLHISYAPKLTELCYCKAFNFSFADLSRQLSNYLPQLVTLSLSMEFFLEDDLVAFPKCTSLKHLEFKVNIRYWLILVTPLKSLIEASPFLYKLKLEITDNNIESRFGDVQEVEGHPNKYLKEVEIVGFKGQPMEVEFVTYLLKSAIELEKIIIHIPYRDYLELERSHSKEFAETRYQMTQKIAHQLMENRAGVELVLL